MKPTHSLRNFLAGTSLALTCTSFVSAADGVFSASGDLGGGNQDANVGLSSSKTYLNAVNIQGGALTINGVSFEGSSGINPSGTNYSTANLTHTHSAASNVTGQLGSLVTDFNYLSNGGTETLTLSNLTAGQTYSLAFYNRSWSNPTSRAQNFTTTGGATTSFNQDFNPTGNLNILRYTFTATGTSEAINIASATNASFHFYGFSTEQVFNKTWTSGVDWTTATWSSAGDPNGVGSNADFTAQGSPTSINLDANRTVGHIRFDGANAWTLSGANTLTMQADVGGVSVLGATSGTHTISTAVNLNSGLLKTGGGTLVLSGAVTDTGKGITLGAGTLGFNTSSAQSLSSAISGGGALTKTGDETLTLSGNNSFTGALTLNGGAVILSGNNQARLAGTGSRTVVNNNTTLQLQANPGNTASGISYALSAEQTAGQPFILNNGGTLQLRSDSSVTFAGGNNFGGLGSATVTFDVNQLNTGNTNQTLTFAPGGFATSQTTLNVTGGNGYSLRLGAISGNNQFLTLNPTTANVNVTGAISNVSTLTKNGGGTLTLGNTGSSYTGVTVLAGGVVNAASFADNGTNSSLGAGTGDTNVNAIGLLFRGGTLQYTGSTAQSTNRAIRLSTAGGTIDASGSTPTATLSFTRASSPNLWESPGNRALTLTGSNTGDNTFAMVIADAGGATSLVKNGVGKWVISGNSTYAGLTTLNAGTLVATSNSALGQSGWSSANKTDIMDGATLALQGGISLSEHMHVFGNGVDGLGAIRSLSGNNALTMHFGGGSSGPGFALRSNVTVGVDADSLSLTGFYQEGGSFGMTKVGAGTLTLSSNSTYTGTTQVSAGTLLVSGQLGASGNPTGLVTVGANGTFGGSGAIFGDVSFDADSKLMVVNLADALTVNGTVTFGTGFGIANLFGIDWDALDLETPYTLLSTTQTFSVLNIANFGYDNRVAVGSGREAYFTSGSLNVIVIPEPATALLGGLGMLALLRRRRA